ncbi:hypothetical protein [Flavobacterium sp. GP15]|nr:hypothetical protein [Flavobacterium sp. GP15]
MERKSLLNQLELSYAPLTAHEFAITKNDMENSNRESTTDFDNGKKEDK